VSNHRFQAADCGLRRNDGIAVVIKIQ